MFECWDLVRVVELDVDSGAFGCLGERKHLSLDNYRARK